VYLKSKTYINPPRLSLNHQNQTRAFQRPRHTEYYLRAGGNRDRKGKKRWAIERAGEETETETNVEKTLVIKLDEFFYDRNFSSLVLCIDIDID
jgi:hypothetical protein